MSKYIKEFQETGTSIINIDLFCKDWNDRFSIYTWINENEEIYQIVVNGKRKNTILCKTKISKEQANEVIKKLNLVYIKDSIFKSAGAYHTKEFIKSEFDRLSKMKQEKEQELIHLRHILYNYENY